MQSTQAAVQGQVSGDVLMYQRPEPLSFESHGRLGMVPSETPYGFASAAHAVPLQVTEFGPASLSYPVIFGGEAYAPLAVMSIRQNENLFVTPIGRFEPESYIPAFIRRYPFVLANDETQQRMIVCVDRGAAFLTEAGEIRLFENGEPTEYTRNAIKFCEDFEQERIRTEAFVKMLRDLDLFETKFATFTPRNDDGTTADPVQISEYFAVSEAKLGQLNPQKLAELRDSGALQQIYAHLNSLFGWDRLITRTLIRAPVVANA